MRCYNCGWDNPDEVQRCEKCNVPIISNNPGKTKWKTCLAGHYYDASLDACPYCLKSQLEDISQESPLFPPSNNAMCYCQPPGDWDNRKAEKDKPESMLKKVLFIGTIILILSIVFVFFILFLSYSFL